jgi:3-hydroxyacyl-[acyl-carrier-protein] dehydratase
MPSKWAPLSPISRTDPERIEACVTYDGDSPWFSGHFPENPVLPGVAMLASVVQLAMEGIIITREDIAGFRKVRFTKLMGPGDELTISLNTSNLPAGNEVFFKIQCGDEKVGQGILLIKKDASG